MSPQPASPPGLQSSISPMPAPSRGTRRARSPSPSGGQSDDEPEGQRRRRPKRQKSDTESKIHAIGKTIGMMVDLFRDFQAVLDMGLSANPDTPTTAMSRKEQKYLQVYEQIISVAPWILDEVARRGPTGSYQIAREMDAGRSAVRGTDIHGIKLAIVSWRPFSPQINPNNKLTRGFSHPQCGALLCPPIYDWDDPAVRASIQNRSRTYPIGPKDWPRFLWRSEYVDSNDYHAGFLRNDLLIKAAKHILLGPTAATSSTRRIASRKPKARIHGIRSATVPFIAYAAVLVHFGLNSQESFNDGSTPGTFKYESFYQALIRHVERDMLEEKRHDLLYWWTLEVFGEQWLEGTDDENENIRPGGHLTMADRMKTQCRERTGQSGVASSGSAPLGTDSANL